MSLTQSCVTFGTLSINLLTDMKVGIGGDRWPAANMFCEFIVSDRWNDFFDRLFYTKSVIELGSGTGFVSLIISKLFHPSKAVATDQESHIQLIQNNIHNNISTDTNNSMCTAEVLDWYHIANSDRDSRRTHPKYDVIIALECVYHEEIYEPFVLSLVACSNADTYIILGMTRDFLKASFFTLFDRYFIYTRIPHEYIQHDLEHVNIALFICQLIPSQAEV